MIIVTGGAGFIGSNIVKTLNAKGADDILVVDHLGTDDKWMNLVGLSFLDYENKDDFIGKVERGVFDHEAKAIVHLGACSSTTEKDADYLASNNYEYSRRLATRFGAIDGVRFVYASSAATYGDGSAGYSDDHEGLAALRPLNMYGYSKQLFDLWALRTGFLERSVGLKYFNVFGPNEFHKGDMRSVAIRAYEQIKKTGRVKLFKSYKPEYKDGEQLRDFIYVKDAADITLHFLENRDANGIFNAGAGEARNFKDLAAAVFTALGLKPDIEFIDMPPGLAPKYQYYTRAEVKKLVDSGYSAGFHTLETAVHDYVINYLEKDPRVDTHSEH